MTKPSKESIKDINGTVIVIGDRIAYAKGNYEGFHMAVHTGVVKRITDRGVWVLPDKKFKHDACELKRYPILGIETTHSYYGVCTTPIYDYKNPKKSMVYDWCFRLAERVLKL